MNILEFNNKLSDLLNEAAKSGLKLGAIVTALEISKTEMICEQVLHRRQLEAKQQLQEMTDAINQPPPRK